MTGRRGKLTAAQIERLVALRERGWSYQSIGAHLAVSAAAVHYQCLKHGAVSPRQRRVESPLDGRSFVGSDGRTQRLFTRADDEMLLALERSGLNYGAIGREMGRARTSVRIRLMTLAMREELPA